VSLVPAITTRVGHTAADELRFHGYKVFAELLGRASVGQMIVLGLTGRLFADDDIATIDDVITAMTSTDPRLWPFKVTRLASSHGNGAYGVAATLIAGEGGMYGTNRLEHAAQWLVDLHGRASATGITDDEIGSVLDAGGGGSFGVLYRARDERFEALMLQVAKRGRHERPFTSLCLHAVRVARERKQLEVHVSLAIAALCLDLGLTPYQIGMFGLVFMFHDALANATEGALQQPPVLQQLPRETLQYAGREARRSPRSLTTTREP
jgi:hypothetical protein